MPVGQGLVPSVGVGPPQAVVGLLTIRVETGSPGLVVTALRRLVAAGPDTAATTPAVLVAKSVEVQVVEPPVAVARPKSRPPSEVDTTGFHGGPRRPDGQVVPSVEDEGETVRMADDQVTALGVGGKGATRASVAAPGRTEGDGHETVRRRRALAPSVVRQGQVAV